MGKLGEWEDIPFFDTESLLVSADKELKVESMEDLRDIRNDLFSNLASVELDALMPSFPRVLYGTEWDVPLLPGEKRALDTKKDSKKDKPKPQRRVVARPSRGGGGLGGGIGGGAPGGMGGVRRGGGRRGGAMGGPGMAGPGMIGGPGMAGPGMMGPGMMGPGVMEPGMMGPGGVNMAGKRTGKVTLNKLTDEERKNPKGT